MLKITNRPAPVLPRCFGTGKAAESLTQWTALKLALERVAAAPPDIVILDLGLPGLSGADAIQAIKKACPGTEILVFTVMEDDDQVFASIQAGASGYLLKDAEPSQLISSIEELNAGGAPMSFSIARKVLREFQAIPRQDGLRGMISPLSDRETQILNRLYLGDSYKEIAGNLGLSIHTIHTHIKNIYSKLHVNSRAQAIYEAVQQKIIVQ